MSEKQLSRIEAIANFSKGFGDLPQSTRSNIIEVAIAIADDSLVKDLVHRGRADFDKAKTVGDGLKIMKRVENLVGQVSMEDIVGEDGFLQRKPIANWAPMGSIKLAISALW